MPTYRDLKEELVYALDQHIDLLKDTATIDQGSLDGVMFMMRSFGFINRQSGRNEFLNVSVL
jgi:hypothetical protein